MTISDEALALCGANYCPNVEAPKTINASAGQEDKALEDIEDNFSASKSSLYTLAGIYLACSLLSAIIVSLLVDPLTQ